jgi:uncharacterized protein (DUF305 family)
MDHKPSNTNILHVLAGLVIGAILATIVVNGTVTKKANQNTSGVTMQMPVANDELSSKTGDELDKAFITQMITHHQGAILMAEEAKNKANHQEIKTMANAIITAQTNEINQMKEWYKTWFGTDLMAEDMNPSAPMSH